MIDFTIWHVSYINFSSNNNNNNNNIKTDSKSLFACYGAKQDEGQGGSLDE